MTDLVEDIDGRLVLPEVKQLFDKMRSRPVPSYPELGVQASREMVEKSVSLQAPPIGDVDVEDIAIAAVPVRLYRPSGVDAPNLLVYLHGGGWVTGSIDVADAPCRDLATATGMVVASVDYRRSPEARFPEPLDDALEAITGLARLRPDLGVSVDRLIVMGDSAGGNLAALATLRLRDLVTDQIVLYPAITSPRTTTYESFDDNADDPILPAPSMTWFWDQYLPEGDTTSASPLADGDLAGIPRTLVLTCSLDVLRDEGRAYAATLADGGVEVSEIRLPGMIHGFLWMSAVFPQVGETLDQIAAWLAKPVST